MIIFIAEDDISLQKSLSRILISLGHQVKVFSNGEQLLEALQQKRTDWQLLHFIRF
jgi:DNA-binding NtrC family response regulator